MDQSVAGVAQGHEVLIFIAAAFGGRNDMVHEISRNKTPGFKTSLAKRMLGDIQIADGMPAAAIGSVVIGAALGLVILAPGDGLMGIAIALGGEPRAAGIGAGMRRSGRHGRKCLLSWRRRTG